MCKLISADRRRLLRAIALVIGFAATGCGSPRPGRVDAELARRSLRDALESWKNGEPPTALRDHSPSITVQDMDWKAGYRLVGYEVIGEGRDGELNLHCPVKLTLRDREGRELEKQVTYVIGTSPVITVFREMSM